MKFAYRKPCPRAPRRLLLAAQAALLAFGVRPVLAANTFGTLSNFDVINDTGEDCHGFEIELDGVTSHDITYTFGDPYEQYGNPRLIDFTDANGKPGVYVRYESQYDPINAVFKQTTPRVSNPTMTTAGHQCWTGGDPGYPNAGCEHFGLGLSGNATNVVYRWLVADPANPGSLKYKDSPVSIPAPIWNVSPPPQPEVNPNPVVQAVIPKEPPEKEQMHACSQWGDAQWLVVYKTETEHAELHHLVTDDPNVPQDASETEVEWQLQQPRPTCDEYGNPVPVGGENELAMEDQPAAGNKSVVRRYEFYRYGKTDAEGNPVGTGGMYDPETHEAMPLKGCHDAPFACKAKKIDFTQPNDDLGDYLGAQMAAINLDNVVGIRIATRSLPAGAQGASYRAKLKLSKKLSGQGPYSWTLISGSLPSGLKLTAGGVIKGTPGETGTFKPVLGVTDAVGARAQKKLTLVID